MTDVMVNGGFESGSTTGWTVTAAGTSGTGATVSSSKYACGSHSCLMTAKYNGSNGYVTIEQTIDARCVTSITFQIATDSGYFPSATARLYLGSDYYNYYPSPSWSGTLTRNLTPAQKVASLTIKFRLTTTDSSNWQRLYVDCVVADSSQAAATADFSADTTTPVVGNTVTFTDASSGGCPATFTYAWTFNPASITYTGGTSATSQNPQVIFNAATTYDVTLVVTNDAGSDGEFKPSYITASPAPAAPTADFYATPTGCKPGESIAFVNITDEGYPAVSAWEWKINGEISPSGSDWEWASGSAYTDEEPEVILNDYGSYSVSLKATNSTGDDTESKTDYLTVTPNPTASQIKNSWCIIIGGYLER